VLPSVPWIAFFALAVVAVAFLLVPGGYWVINPTVPRWVPRWLLWPLRRTSRQVLRLQGWAAVLLGLCVLLVGLGSLSPTLEGPLAAGAFLCWLAGTPVYVYSVWLSVRRSAPSASAART